MYKKLLFLVLLAACGREMRTMHRARAVVRNIPLKARAHCYWKGDTLTLRYDFDSIGYNDQDRAKSLSYFLWPSVRRNVMDFNPRVRCVEFHYQVIDSLPVGQILYRFNKPI